MSCAPGPHPLHSYAFRGRGAPTQFHTRSALDRELLLQAAREVKLGISFQHQRSNICWLPLWQERPIQLLQYGGNAQKRAESSATELSSMICILRIMCLPSAMQPATASVHYKLWHARQQMTMTTIMKHAFRGARTISVITALGASTSTT